MSAPGRRLVIVGAGMAGMAVAEAVLAHDPGWDVTLVGREPDAHILVACAFGAAAQVWRSACLGCRICEG